MNITMMRRGAEYLVRLCLLGSSKPEQIDFYPQKLHSVTDWDPPAMPELSSPESVGVSSAYIREFLDALEKDPLSQVHNLLIYRNDKLISAASAPGYSPRLCSMTFSMAKTITSFAIGCLIGEGRLRLDTRLVDVFPEELPLLVSSKTKKITIRHLLTMTAGVTGVHELAAVTLTDWRRAFLASTPSTIPGKSFFYNSLNSYMLAATVEKITGRSLEDYLREHLFEPLGIEDYEIERSPEGIAKGGWGMYITPIDMAKLGRMLLAGGVWEGKRILPADYVTEAIRPHISTSHDMGDYDYGFHLWVARDGSAVMFHGMLGQNIWVCPKNNMVVVITCGNDEFYLESSTIRLLDKTFGQSYYPSDSLRRAPIETVRLRRCEQDFFCLRHGMQKSTKHTDYFTTLHEREVPETIFPILGEYEFDLTNVGMLPLYWRSIQNNHNPGISRVAFRLRDKQLYMSVTEGTERELLCGFRSHAYTVLNYGGERYLVGTRCAIVKDEAHPDAFALRVDMVYPELPFSRSMRFILDTDGTMTVKCSECPGNRMMTTLVEGVGANIPWMSTIAGILSARMGDVAPQTVISWCVEPTLYAHRYERKGTPPPLGAGDEHGFFYRLVPRKLRRIHRPKLPKLSLPKLSLPKISLPKLPNPFKKRNKD